MTRMEGFNLKVAGSTQNSNEIILRYGPKGAIKAFVRADQKYLRMGSKTSIYIYICLTAEERVLRSIFDCCLRTFKILRR